MELKHFLSAMKDDERLATPAYLRGAKIAVKAGRPDVAKMLRAHARDEKRHYNDIVRVKI